MIIDGKKIAGEILARLATLPKPKQFLAGILVGDDPASLSFLVQKQKVAKTLGVDFRIYTLQTNLGNDGLRDEIGKIAAHKTCGGALIELPVPQPLTAQYLLNAIPPEKDVDVLGERALGTFSAGRGKILPPAVATIKEILHSQKLDLKKIRAAVVGRGLLVGQPAATWLMREARELTVFGEEGNKELLRTADIVISGAGKSDILVAEMMKAGALVIDFGYDNRKGDFNPAGAEEKNISYTPTPGGTGPILIAKLFENFYALSKKEKN